MVLNNPEKWIRVKYFTLKDVNTDLKPIFHHIWDQIRPIHLGFPKIIIFGVFIRLGPDPEYSIYGKLSVWEMARWDLIPLGNYPFTLQNTKSIMNFQMHQPWIRHFNLLKAFGYIEKYRKRPAILYKYHAIDKL